MTVVLQGHDTSLLGQGYLPFVHFAITTNPGHGTLTPNGPVQTDGIGDYTESYTYTPTAGYNGPDSFNYTFSVPSTSGTWQKFNSSTSIGTHTGIFLDVEVANENGQMDIIAAMENTSGTSGALYLYTPNGSGGYNTPKTISTTYVTDSVALGDFAGNGYTDFVAYNVNGPAMVYMWNNSTGTFNAGIALTSSPSNATGTGSVAVGDLTGNGHPDIVVGEPSGPDLIYMNYAINGQWGNFGSPVQVNTTSYGVTSAVALGDVLGTGLPDLIVGKIGDAPLIIPNDGYGDFNTANAIQLPAPTGIKSPTDIRATSIAVGDCTGNGYDDIVVAFTEKPGVTTDTAANTEAYYANTNYTFTSVQDFNSGAVSMSVKLADLNHSGTLAVVAGNTTGSTNYFLFDTKTSTYDGLNSTEGSVASAHSWGIDLADVNNDGNFDYIGGGDSAAMKLKTNKGFAALTSTSTKVTVTVA